MWSGYSSIKCTKNQDNLLFFYVFSTTVLPCVIKVRKKEKACFVLSCFPWGILLASRQKLRYNSLKIR